MDAKEHEVGGSGGRLGRHLKGMAVGTTAATLIDGGSISALFEIATFLDKSFSDVRDCCAGFFGLVSGATTVLLRKNESLFHGDLRDGDGKRGAPGAGGRS